MCNISTIIQDFNVCFYEKDHNLNMNRNLPLSMSPYGFSATRVPLVKCEQAYCGEDTFSRVHMFTFRRVVRLQSGLKRWAATLLWPKILPKIEWKRIEKHCLPSRIFRLSTVLPTSAYFTQQYLKCQYGIR